MEEYTGQRQGSLRFHYDGFDYRRDNEALLTVKQFRCAVSKCNGRAKYDIDTPNIVTVTKCHNHARDRGPFQTFKLRKELSKRASEDLTTKISTIFQEVCRKYPRAATLVHPDRERARMRRIRRALLPTTIPPSYSELAELLSSDERLNDKYGRIDPQIEGGAREVFFLKKLTDPNGKVSLVFGNEDLFQTCLQTTTKIKVDATFKTLSRKPKGRQLFSVHACHGTHTFPVCFALMEAKSTSSYRQVLQYIKEQVPYWQPDEVVTDFECSLRKAVKKEFPSAEITGCYFHYTQAVQTNWSKHGLLRISPNLQKQAKKFKDSLMALPFAKAEDIAGIFESLESDEYMPLALRQKLTNFIKYFKKTWLSKNDKNFKPEDYSVYGKADRTNNHVESFHSTLHEVHPNIWRLLELLGHKIITSRQNYGRFHNGIDISASVPVKILYNDIKIAQGRALYEAGRIKPLVFVNWCRTSIKHTLAVVRQGRRLRRLLKAEEYEVEFDDVETDSDSSIDSEYDFDFQPNPGLLEVMEAEDANLMADWENEVRSSASENENGSDNGEDEEMPSDNDSMWELPEDEELGLIQASQFIEDAENPDLMIPNEAVPVIQATERDFQLCITCLENERTVLVLPCKHNLLCTPCSHLFFEEKCPTCAHIITGKLDFYTP